MTKTTIVSGLALAAVLTVFPFTAFADDHQDCETGKGRDPIAACTRILDDGKLEAYQLARILYLRGFIWDEKGEVDKALIDYNRSIEVHPRIVGPFVNRGVIFAERGEYENAIEDYSRAIEINDKFALSYEDRGLAFAEMGEHDKAIADYESAMTLEPGTKIRVLNYRGECHRSKGQYELAIRDFNEAIELDRDYASAFNNRAITYRLTGEAPRAKKDFERAARLDPDGDPDKMRDRGLALFYLGRFGRAIGDFDRALRIQPKSAMLLYFRGKVKLKDGKMEAGNADVTAAEAINPRIARALDGYFVP